jgi:hypothetical protein
MAITQKSSIQSGDYIVSDAIIAFKKSNVMFPLVKSQVAPKGSSTVKFTYYADPSSGNVGAGTESSDYTSTTERAISASTATIAEYIVRTDVTDMAQLGSPSNLSGDVGQMLGQEMALKADDLLTDLFSGFSNTVAGEDTALSLASFFDASRVLHANGAPLPFNFVGSPKSIWGTYGIQALLTHTNSGSQVADNPTSQAMLANGYVAQLAGVNIYWSPEVSEDIDTDSDSTLNADAGMFSAGALGIGVASSGLVDVKQQRDESARATEYIGILRCGVSEVKDSFGVYMKHKV